MCRQSCGMPRSPISHVTWCSDSGESVQKSHCMSWSRRPLRARRFCDRMKFWNFMGSRMKKTGVLLPTMSQLPSRVHSLRAKPRGSRQVSGLPRSPATVENRISPVGLSGLEDRGLGVGR